MIENLQQTFFIFFLLTIFIPSMSNAYDPPDWFMVVVLSAIIFSGSGAITTTLVLIWEN